MKPEAPKPGIQRAEVMWMWRWMGGEGDDRGTSTTLSSGPQHGWGHLNTKSMRSHY